MQLRTRFAPSPTGLLHVGNAYSALQCQAWAEANHAELLLRIEDIDFTRCKSEFTDHILEDLHWLGLTWETPVRIQSKHSPFYQQAIVSLQEIGVIYPCFCTRKEIQLEIQRMASAPHNDEPVIAYPGTCRDLEPETREQKLETDSYSWRLNIDKAMAVIGPNISWHDDMGNKHPVFVDHDIVIARKDIGLSYHLAVVMDDALQGITHIIRGEDLIDSTPIHRLLQQLLKLPEPTYLHHPLIHTATGDRLAKRNHATTLQSLRQAGIQPDQLRRYLLSREKRIWPFDGNLCEEDKNRIVHLLGNS